MMEISEWFKTIGETLGIGETGLKIVLAVFFIVLGLFLRQVIVKIIISTLFKLAKKTGNKADETLVYAIDRPLRSFIFGLSIWAALSVFTLPAPFRAFITLILRTFFILMLFWFFYRASDSISWLFERHLGHDGKKPSPMLVSTFRKVLKIILFILETFMLVNEFGFDISGLVAGLGIGGLAISLAAKDAAANLLGSITVMLDKTYKIGDWIQTDKVEGVVEEIGFRSTKIRTFSNALIHVPNSSMSNEPVINWSRMGKRRVSYTLHIPLDTPPEKIEALLSRIREMLNSHEDLNKDMIVVNMTGFGDETLEILIYFFTKTTSWVTYLEVSEDVNLKVLQIFKEEGIPIIAPAKRVLVEAAGEYKVGKAGEYPSQGQDS